MVAAGPIFARLNQRKEWELEEFMMYALLQASNWYGIAAHQTLFGLNGCLKHILVTHLFGMLLSTP